MTTKELQYEIACLIVDDVCGLYPEFVAEDRNAELAAVACRLIEDTLSGGNYFLIYEATPRQKKQAGKWEPAIRAEIYRRLGVRLTA